ncbi:PEF-CTERM sorting domain-containing protein [Methanolobus sp. WCC4]|uniref:PEF-CTERM sorting domain-containing protein n=1 Tax=Methanolobus sp. WCC4 TaxID=3125784 RepID=UPI0030F6C6F6
MKRTILTILIGISMLLSVGAASAVTTYDCGTWLYSDTDAQSIATFYVTCDDGNVTVSLPETSEITRTNLKEITVSPAPSSVIDELGRTWPMGNDVGPYSSSAYFPVGFVNYTSPDKSTPVSKVYLNYDECPDITIAIHGSWSNVDTASDNPDSTWVYNSCEGDDNGGGGTGGEETIPEFPTIALPIAAIIGLAFYFQRRKE